MITKILAAASFIALATLPVVASAAVMQESPVQLNQTGIVQSYGIFNAFEPGRVSISFTNRAAVAATNVTFNLVDGNGTILAQYKDAGSYNPGTTVRHNFNDTHDETNQKIEVAAVRFADGSTWSAPSNSSTDVQFPAE